MSRSARTQWVIGIVGFVAFAAAMAWMLTHRKAAPPAAPGAGGPKLAALRAVNAGNVRNVKAGDTITTLESLDFEVEVSDLCFVYVVSAHNGETTVQWAPEPSEPWDRGAYAPDWSKENPDGLRFPFAGDVELFLISSPSPLADIERWPPVVLSAPQPKCPHCTSTSVKLKVIDAVPERFDAGSM